MARIGLVSDARRIPNPAWAWEGLRRNANYRKVWRQVAPDLPRARELITGANYLKATTLSEVASKWGLVTFSDPDKSSFNTPVFWQPTRLAGALRVALFPLGSDNLPNINTHDIIVLAALGSRRAVLDGLDGVRHILLGGNRFWIQLYCETPGAIDEQAHIGLRIDGARHMGRQLDSAAQLLSLHRSAGGKLSLIGRRKSSIALYRAVAAFDIWHGFERRKGSLEDVAAMIVGPSRMAKDWGKNDRALKAQARRAIVKGEAFVGGEYVKLLTQKIL